MAACVPEQQGKPQQKEAEENKSTGAGRPRERREEGCRKRGQWARQMLQVSQWLLQ
jgi:hypothetical protein